MSDVIGDDEKGLAHDPSRLRRRILAYRWAFVLAGFPTGIGLLVGMSRGLGHLPMRVSQVVFLASVLSVLALRAADESLIRAYAAGAFDGLRSQGRFSALLTSSPA